MYVICKYHAVASALHVHGDMAWNGYECMTWSLNKVISSEGYLVNFIEGRPINFIGGLSNKLYQRVVP